MARRSPGLWERGGGAAQRPALRRRAPGAGGRKDSLETRESGARAWPGYITFRAGSETRRTRGGARGPDPRERPPGQKRLPAVWSSRSSSRRCLGGLSRAAGPAAVSWESPGCEVAAGRRLELGPVCPRGSRGSRSAVRGPEAPAGGVPRGPADVVTRCALEQLPGGSASACLGTSRLWGSAGCAPRGRAQAGSVVSRALLKPWGRHQSPSRAPIPGLTALGPAGGALEPRRHSDSAVVPATRAGAEEMGFPAPALHPPALGTQQPASEAEEGP